MPIGSLGLRRIERQNAFACQQCSLSASTTRSQDRDGTVSEQAPDRGPEPSRWGIVLFFCSLVSAIAIVAIARGWF
jgi:hypothetical protein